MASARQRDGRWTGLYRDRQGRQRSADTYDTKTSAMKAARASEAIEATGRDAHQVLDGPELLHRAEKKGKLTVAGYAPTWLAGHGSSRPAARPTPACSSTSSASWPTSRWRPGRAQGAHLHPGPGGHQAVVQHRRPGHDDAPHDVRDRSRRPAYGSRPDQGRQRLQSVGSPSR
jgi:hypothetical protein